MDVNRSEPAVPVIKREARTDHRPRHEQEEETEDRSDDTQDDDRWSEDDAVDIGGALSGGVTPEVQVALEALAARIEPMRKDLERARERELALRERLEHHPYLPVLNRHGMEHEVSRIGARAIESGANRVGSGEASVDNMPAFVCLSIRNAPDIRRRFGRMAYDRSMVRACEILRKCLSATDIIGCLGGDDLGAIVFDANGAAGSELIERIERAFAETTVIVNGVNQTLEIDIGVSGIAFGGTFAATLAAADEHLIKRASPQTD